jgi:hypothetical protein
MTVIFVLTHERTPGIRIRWLLQKFASTPPSPRLPKEPLPLPLQIPYCSLSKGQSVKLNVTDQIPVLHDHPGPQTSPSDIPPTNHYVGFCNPPTLYPCHVGIYLLHGLCPGESRCVMLTVDWLAGHCVVWNQDSCFEWERKTPPQWQRS